MISRETDYAIRMLRYLSDGELHNTGQMCEAEHIPTKFGYKILEKLQKAEMIECVRGRNGGCRLKTDLNEISLLEIMDVTGSRYSLNQCLEPEASCEWQESHPDQCRVHNKLNGLQEELRRTLHGISMYELIWQD